MKLEGLRLALPVTERPELARPEPAQLEASAAWQHITALPNVATTADPESKFQTVVLLPMTCADRRRVRRRVTAPDGLEFALALPTGTELSVGATLFEHAGRVYRVAAALEDVAVIAVQNWPAAVRVAHAIGNLHRDVQITPSELLALWDAPLELLLLRLGAAFTREPRAFLGRPSWAHP